MRVLWLSGNPALYASHKKGYNNGGWIGALEQTVKAEKNIELGIAFLYNDDCFKSIINGTIYYPINLYNSKIQKLKHNLFYSRYDQFEIEALLKIVDDFKPDIIHVWGTEISFGLIKKHVTIPVVIHIQGLLNPVFNAFYPPSTSVLDYGRRYVLNPIKLINFLKEIYFFKYNAKREVDILKQCKHFIGRTDWDKSILSLYAPDAKYFYCSEALRNEFYEAKPRLLMRKSKLRITSTISKTSYKGFDTILKTAQLLKNLSSIEFEWNVFGISEYKEWEKKTGIIANDVHVNYRGIVNASQLIEVLNNSDIFVHPSYIDNSPNSVCEAQYLGIPVIATNVGGIPSLIEDQETGILIPANAPYTLASKIIELKNNPIKATQIGCKAREVAIKRHDRANIKNDIFQIYKQLVNTNSYIL